MFEIVCYKGETLDTGCQIALENGLYVPGWMLKYELADAVREACHPGAIAIGFVDDVPACCVFITRDNQAMAYCKVGYRRRKYTSKCVEAVRQIVKVEFADLGITGSAKFWQAVGVPLTNPRVVIFDEMCEN